LLHPFIRGVIAKVAAAWRTPCNLSQVSAYQGKMDEDVERLLEQRRYPEAFERLLDRYEQRVFRFTLSIVRNTTRAEDVTQDVFLKLWKALPGYDSRASLSTWLYVIARNTAVSARRAMRNDAPVENADVAASEPAPEPPDVMRFVAQLPDVQRDVITLFYIHERRIGEIAEVLHMPEGTVKSHLHRARRALADRMRGAL
jgi:RNA polymerase sigma-70 factor (ECF subfamily)